MTAGPVLLIVDDEPAIRLFLSQELADAGYTVLTAPSGEAALVALQEREIDLMLLDLRMKGMDGLQVLEEMLRLCLTPAVIILTAHATLNAAIGALRGGATDFLVKPCTSEELLDSVSRALVRRAQQRQQQELVDAIAESVRQLRALEPARPPVHKPAAGSRFLEARGLLVDQHRQSVKHQGELLDLTATEFSLLVYLMQHPDRPLPFAELTRALHGAAEDEASARQALKTHLWRLKRKLGQGPDGKDYLVAVRGRGYKFLS